MNRSNLSLPRLFSVRANTGIVMCACLLLGSAGAGAAGAQMSCKDMGSMGAAKDGPKAAKPAAAASTSLVLTVAGKATTLTPADLAAMPQVSVKVHNEHTKMDETYSGVALGELLGKYGLPVGHTTHQAMLRSYIEAAGTDKYWVLYSVTEIEASEHTADVIVATSMDGKGLGADGQMKLVDSADKKPQRWVRNLAAITVKSGE